MTAKPSEKTCFLYFRFPRRQPSYRYRFRYRTKLPLAVALCCAGGSAAHGDEGRSVWTEKNLMDGLKIIQAYPHSIRM